MHPTRIGKDTHGRRATTPLCQEIQSCPHPSPCCARPNRPHRCRGGGAPSVARAPLAPRLPAPVSAALACRSRAQLGRASRASQEPQSSARNAGQARGGGQCARAPAWLDLHKREGHLAGSHRRPRSLNSLARLSTSCKAASAAARLRNILIDCTLDNITCSGRSWVRPFRGPPEPQSSVTPRELKYSETHSAQIRTRSDVRRRCVQVPTTHFAKTGGGAATSPLDDHSLVLDRPLGDIHALKMEQVRPVHTHMHFCFVLRGLEKFTPTMCFLARE